MKPRLLFLVLIVVIGISTVGARKPVDIAESAVIDSVYDIVDLYAYHIFTYKELFPPANQSFIQTDSEVFPARFKEKLEKQLVWERDANGFALARVLVLEDFFTRETVVLNSRLEEIARVLPFPGYDPYGWITAKYGTLSPEMLLLYDSARIWAEFTLIPAEQYEDYILEAEQQRLTELAMPFMMSKSLPATVTKLMVGISESNGMPVVEVGWPSGYESESGFVDLFAASDLIVRDWQLASSNILTSGQTSYTWIDTGSYTSRFFVAGTDDDQDSDGITSAREKYLYGTNLQLKDSDSDGLSDGDELNLYNSNPLVHDSMVDSDNDSVLDILEHVLGTSPTNPNDPAPGSCNITVTSPYHGQVLD